MSERTLLQEASELSLSDEFAWRAMAFVDTGGNGA